MRVCKNIINNLLQVLPFFILLFCLFNACSPTNDPEEEVIASKAYVVVAHAATKQNQALDLYINDKPIAQNLNLNNALPTDSNYLFFESGKWPLSFNATNNSNQVVFSGTASWVANQAYTLIAIDKDLSIEASTTALILLDSLPKPIENQTWVRFVHAAAAIDTAIFTLSLSNDTQTFFTDTLVFSPTAIPNMVSGWQAYPADTFDVTLKNAQNNQTYAQQNKVALQPGQYITIYAAGNLLNDIKLGFLPVKTKPAS